MIHSFISFSNFHTTKICTTTKMKTFSVCLFLIYNIFGKQTDENLIHQLFTFIFVNTRAQIKSLYVCLLYVLRQQKGREFQTTDLCLCICIYLICVCSFQSNKRIQCDKENVTLLYCVHVG